MAACLIDRVYTYCPFYAMLVITGVLAAHRATIIQNSPLVFDLDRHVWCVHTHNAHTLFIHWVTYSELALVRGLRL